VTSRDVACEETRRRSHRVGSIDLGVKLAALAEAAVFLSLFLSLFSERCGTMGLDRISISERISSAFVGRQASKEELLIARGDDAASLDD